MQAITGLDVWRTNILQETHFFSHSYIPQYAGLCCLTKDVTLCCNCRESLLTFLLIVANYN